MKLVVAQKGSLDAAGPGIGTMASQNATAVAVTGGSVNGTTIGLATAAAAKFTTLNLSSLPTSPTGLAAGTVWNNGGSLAIA